MGIWHPKLIPKTAQKRVPFGDLKNAIQPVIYVPENGVCPVRGSQKWLKNDPKKEQILEIKNANLAFVIICPYDFIFLIEGLDLRARGRRHGGHE